MDSTQALSQGGVADHSERLGVVVRGGDEQCALLVQVGGQEAVYVAAELEQDTGGVDHGEGKTQQA
ncbi:MULTISPECIES: hypothetical protein [Streptomyces]|uniref:hypothetical protein n=1 Tax=Streptomyces TaxID=1883 RepID=UPI0031E03D31